MNREKAAEMLSQGYQLTHKYFTENEFIELKKDIIITEDGYEFTDNFWGREMYEDGCELVPNQDMISK